MAQPYQELSIFGGEGYLDNDTLNSPEQFWIIWLHLAPAFGISGFNHPLFFFFLDPWALDTYSSVGLSEEPDLALGITSNGRKIGECTYNTILNKVLL